MSNILETNIMGNLPENNHGSIEYSLTIFENTAHMLNNNLHKTLSGSLESICDGFDSLFGYENQGVGNQEVDLDAFPTGYRFLPNDEELICAYLLPKLAGEKLPTNRIHNVNVYLKSPEELSEMYPSQGENSWYFFTQRERKYANGKRPNRAVMDKGNSIGYWKATGSDKDVINEKDGKLVGARKALVYYTGKAPGGEKQPWIMHEYISKDQSREPDGKDWKLDDCVLCKTYRKRETHSRDDNDKGKARARKSASLSGDNNDKGKAPARKSAKLSRDNNDKGKAQDDQDQVQPQQVGNEKQGLFESDSPGSVSSILMETERANNFSAYNCSNHEDYFSFPTIKPYFPYHPSTGMGLPMPGVLYGNNVNHIIDPFKPMPMVEKQYKPNVAPF